jgi:hypothetical protein
VRLVLIEDFLASMGDPDTASVAPVPDLPELGALPIVGASDFLAVLVNPVFSLLIFVT